MVSDDDKLVAVIGLPRKDGSMLIRGRDWVFRYKCKSGDLPPKEMALKIESMRTRWLQQKMIEKADEYQRELNRRAKSSRDGMVIDMLRDIEGEMTY